MSSDDQFRLEITAQADPSYSLDTIENTAQVSTLGSESYYSNNESMVITQVIHPVIPAPWAIVLGSIGLGLVDWLERRSTV